MTGILDYGMGNLRSVEKAIAHLGFAAEITPKVSGTYDRLIIPGVGAFGAAMERLAPMALELAAYVRGGNPLLGICLGQQLLFEVSEEHGEHAGLGFIPGRVRYLPREEGLKVPHMGWSPLTFRHFEGLGTGSANGDQVYFVHSLYTDCAEPADIAATAHYGLTFPATVQRGNVWGAQFHPEKSGDVGLRMLRSFLTC